MTALVDRRSKKFSMIRKSKIKNICKNVQNHLTKLGKGARFCPVGLLRLVIRRFITSSRSSKDVTGRYLTYTCYLPLPKGLRCGN